jgi:hypothetical protein
MNRPRWQLNESSGFDSGRGEQSFDPYHGAPGERDERGVGSYGENP